MGTYIINPTRGILTFDAVPRIGFQPSARVTEHPLEDGSTVTDHAQANPRSVFISGVVAGQPLQKNTLIPKFDPMREAVEFLNASVGVALTVVTPNDGTFTNMLLTRWPHDTTQIRRKIFDLELREVQFASVGFVALAAVAASAASGFQAAQDIGDQATEQLDPNSSMVQSQEQTLLVQGAAWAANVFGGG